MNLSTELTVAIITGTIAVIVSAAAFLYGWVNVGPLRAIIEELKSEIRDLKEDITQRKEREVLFEAKNSHYLKRIVYLTEGIRILLDQIKRHNEPPCWEPIEWDPDDIGDELNRSASRSRRTKPREESG